MYQDVMPMPSHCPSDAVVCGNPLPQEILHEIRAGYDPKTKNLRFNID